MNRDVLAALLDAIEQRESVALVSITDGTDDFAEKVGQHAVIWQDADRAIVGDLALDSLPQNVVTDVRQAIYERKHHHFSYETNRGTVKLFAEVQAKPPHLIIVGAGHIAVPLAQIAKINEFEVTVLDDRSQFAHVARFPTADRVIVGPFRSELDNLRPSGPGGVKRPFDNHTYIVLVTRGHQYDVESLLEVIDDPMAYIGMIGSQRRIRAVFELLEKEQKVDPKKFDRVYAPIGIAIGARTPAEIAVCIMAEMINVLREGPAVGLSQQIRAERQRRIERVKNR